MGVGVDELPEFPGCRQAAVFDEGGVAGEAVKKLCGAGIAHPGKGLDRFHAIVVVQGGVTYDVVQHFGAAGIAYVDKEAATHQRQGSLRVRDRARSYRTSAPRGSPTSARLSAAWTPSWSNP